MALARISLEPPPDIDPTKATLAYGRLAIKRLNRELRDKTLLIRQRATKALTDYLHDHEHIAEAIKEGVVGSLNFLLKDPDVHVRAYATECLRVISQHHLGREAVLHENVLLSFIDLVKMSEVDIIRLTAQKTIELITMLPSGVNAAIELGYIEILGECARNEVDEIKVVVLTTLNHILNTNTTRALAAGQSRLFTRLLLHPSEDIRATAAQNILRLCVDPRGKQEALDEETIPALVKLLADNCWRVRASATGALAFTELKIRSMKPQSQLCLFSSAPAQPTTDDMRQSTAEPFPYCSIWLMMRIVGFV
ncbi:unnamed protein product [Calicophoron daubneyi]|uniref:Radial spoke head 14 homolog n=1 Tax=Calicophoron daubneyi TaxID=300641 RepID=A0AAV2TLG8_CALDB